jgi:hypothetical protein
MNATAPIPLAGRGSASGPARLTPEDQHMGRADSSLAPAAPRLWVPAAAALCVLAGSIALFAGAGIGRGAPIMLVALAGVAVALLGHSIRTGRRWIAVGGSRVPAAAMMAASVVAGLVVPLMLWWPTPTLLADAAARGDRKRIAFHLALGLDVNDGEVLTRGFWFIGDPGLRTPLYEAVVRGDTSLAEFLLRRGADPNLTCGPVNGRALPLAHALSRGDQAMAALLRSHGAIETRGPTAQR